MSTAKSNFSPKEVAKALAVSESSVKRWCDQGKINLFRTAGGHRRMRQQDVIEFVRTNRYELVDPDSIGLESSSDICCQPIQDAREAMA